MATAEPNADGIDDEDKEETPTRRAIRLAVWVIFNLCLISLFIWATIYYINFDHRKCNIIEKDENDENEENEENEDNKNNEENEKDEANNSTTKPPMQCELDWCHGYGFFMLLVIIFYIFFIYYVVIKRFFGQKIYETAIEPAHTRWMEISRTLVVSLILLGIVIAIVLIVVIFESRNKLQKCIGICGPIVFVFTGFIFSKYPRQIAWRIVVTGLFLQFIFGLMAIRWSVGRSILECAGKKVTQFLNYTRAGSTFVYGEDIVNNFIFAFGILAVIFFSSVIISILYYWGIMQALLRVLGWTLQSTMGTTVCESVNAAGNVFLGMTESPLMIRPYIALLTASEMHAVMVSGFATVAGTVFGAYISFGANAAYLISVSIMAAPASLAIAKLYYPETEESQTSAETIKLDKSTDTSVLDAIGNGASNGMLLVLGIVANVVAFLAIVEFLNAVVEWIFELAGLTDVTFIVILTYVFMPLVFLMGVPWQDCYNIGKIVAKKTLINEFIAYSELGKLDENGSVEKRSVAIATFAICGFANPGSLGILVASLCTMAPERRAVITAVAIRAFVAGSVVSFISASWAGILVQE